MQTSSPDIVQPLCLAKRVSDALAENSYLPRTTELNCTTDEGRVTLRGTVGSFYQKQMAQELIRRIDGVETIENHLEVDWS